VKTNIDYRQEPEEITIKARGSAIIVFTKTDIWRAILAGEVIALLALPILKNLKIFDTAFIIPWLILLPLCAGLGLYIIYRISIPRWPIFFDLAKYGLVGWLNLFLSASIFNLLVLTTRITKGLWAVIFIIIAFIITVTHSFFWNKFWIFPSRGISQTKQEYIKFFVVSGTTACVETLIFHILINVMGAPSGLSQELWNNIALFTLIPVALLGNFLGYKLIVFKNSHIL